MKVIHLRTLCALLIVAALAGCGKNEPAQSEKSPGKASSTDQNQSGTPGKESQANEKEEKEEKEEKGQSVQPEAKENHGEKEEHEEGNLSLSPVEMQAAGITVSPLKEQQVVEQITVTATIGANQNRFAHVAPRVAGKVTKVFANLGDKVKHGQVLANLDSIEVGEAQSAYLQAVSEHALAKSAMDRAEKLYAEQIIPQKEYLRTKADLEKAKAVMRAAQDKRQALGLQGQKLAASGNSVFAVTAPFAGTVIEKDAVLGELAEPNKALFIVADLSTVWIEADLYEKDLGKVKVGSPAAVTLAAYPSEVFNGKVTYISSVMDKESRTLKARIEVPNQDARLKLDMFATAAIATGGNAKALMLPQEAVVLIQGQPTAFVQEESGFEARPVELGDKLRDQVVLKSGISPGEKIVTRGAYALKARMLKSQIGDAD